MYNKKAAGCVYQICMCLSERNLNAMRVHRMKISPFHSYRVHRLQRDEYVRSQRANDLLLQFFFFFLNIKLIQKPNN